MECMLALPVRGRAWVAGCPVYSAEPLDRSIKNTYPDIITRLLEFAAQSNLIIAICNSSSKTLSRAKCFDDHQ